MLCSVHCACFHKHNLQHNRRRQSPTSTKPFVCAYLFLVCARHAPTFACPSSAHAWHLPARALSMPAACAEFCLHVFAVLVFLAYCRRWYSAAEQHCTGQSIQGSANGPTQIPGRVDDSSGFILRVIKPQTLCLSVSCFYLHSPCAVLPQRALLGGSDRPQALAWNKVGGETTRVRFNEAGRRPQRVHIVGVCWLFFSLKVVLTLTEVDWRYHMLDVSFTHLSLKTQSWCPW